MSDSEGSGYSDAGSGAESDVSIYEQCPVKTCLRGSRFMTKSDTNGAVQPQKKVTDLKFWI